MRENLKRQIEAQAHGPRMKAFRCCSALAGLIGLLAVFLFAPNLPAQNKTAPAPAQATVSSNRWLFIVDTSSSMERHSRDVQKLVVDLLSSGASGQMHRGDTLGVWTFNADVYTGNIPLQRWIPEDWWPIASRTQEFLQQQRYTKRSRLDRALVDMYEVITNSDIITVFLISNGEGKMQGSPFDAEINAVWKQSLKEMKKDRMPVITVLQAKGGRIINYSVAALPWPVIVPELPVAVKKVEPTPAAVAQITPATNQPAITIAATTPPPVAPQPPPAAVAQNTPANNQPNATIAAAATPPPVTQPPPPPIFPQQNTAPAASAPAHVANVLPQPTPAQLTPPTLPRPAFNPGGPSTSPQPAVPPAFANPTMSLPTRQFRPPPSNPVVNANPAPPSAAPAKPMAITSTLPAALLMPKPATPAQSPATATSVTPMPKRVETAKANLTTNASVAHATNSHVVQAAVVLPPTASPRPKLFLIAGVSLALIALGLIVALVRRARTPSGPSLISSSMNDQQK